MKKMKKKKCKPIESNINYRENNSRQSRPRQIFIPSGDPDKKGSWKTAKTNW